MRRTWRKEYYEYPGDDRTIGLQFDAFDIITDGWDGVGHVDQYAGRTWALTIGLWRWQWVFLLEMES